MENKKLLALSAGVDVLKKLFRLQILYPNPPVHFCIFRGTAITPTKDNIIKLWNLTTRSLTRTFVEGGQVGTIRFSPDGKNLTAVSLVPNSVDGQIQVWQVGTGKLIHRIQNITWCAGISISPDEKNYAIAGNGITAQVLDLMTDKTITSFNEEGWILFTPDGKSLLIASAQGIQVWQ